MTDTENTKIISLSDAFEIPDIKKKFNDMLGNKATGFKVSVLNVVSTNDKLRNADRNSILFAAATAASLDLPINPNLGFAYIIPYNQKVGNAYKQVAQFQIGYRGFIQLAQRSGLYKTISSTPVYEGQLIGENPLTGFTFDWSAKRSEKIIGYAAYFSLLNGFEKVLYMTIAELEKHGKRYSVTYKSNFGMWRDDFHAMATKTVIKQLITKFGPLSVDMQRAVITDQAISTNIDGENIAYPDNIPLSIDEISQHKEEARIKEFIEKTQDLIKLFDGVKDYIEVLPDDHELKIIYDNKVKELSDVK